jgi:hypothetical protein
LIKKQKWSVKAIANQQNQQRFRRTTRKKTNVTMSSENRVNWSRTGRIKVGRKRAMAVFMHSSNLKQWKLGQSKKSASSGTSNVISQEQKRQSNEHLLNRDTFEMVL